MRPLALHRMGTAIRVAVENKAVASAQVFYYIPEDKDTQEHPNVFQMAAGAEIRLKDVRPSRATQVVIGSRRK